MDTLPATGNALRFCLTCGEQEGTPWVTARCRFEEAEEKAAPPEYVASFRYYNPKGTRWINGYFAGCIMRVGAKRATAVCGHRHGVLGDAEACGRALLAARSAE